MKNDLAQTLMTEFADSTGISGKTSPRRYLWTDAFAVCNFLGLYRTTGNDQYLNFALELVHQVHHILGRHRANDVQHGWISGLSEVEGERHPTRGGLRIGKTLNERGPDQPVDARLEWDRDGQYFHYLTKWMHALYCVCRETGENRYLSWAAELAMTAHRAFTYEISPGAPKRMVWKMSIDLSRPLVDSMGHHDPLDGLIACLELQIADGFAAQEGIDMTPAIADFDAMCASSHWATHDPLGIGGLLDHSVRLSQMVYERGVDRRELLVRLFREIVLSLQMFERSSPLDESAEHRLAFRELGLSIGLRGLGSIAELVSHDRELKELVNRLLPYHSLVEQIESVWLEPRHRHGRMWIDHRDINTVMLATSLAPEAYLRL